MLEAKGVGGFTNRQLNDKVKRLGKIFGEDGKKWEGVMPHFVILAPKLPKGLKPEGWPTWIPQYLENSWMKLSIPPGLKRITRCDKDGNMSANGKYWKAVKERKSISDDRTAS
ncbi:MAG: hypothetical protein HY664_01575 [Chloroflexi bacterium]|nr:hypothetical protein [Chloroflexota bacterium]